MKPFFLIVAAVFSVFTSAAQTIQQQLATAMKQLEADAQLAHAITGLYIVDSKTGKVIYDHHGQVGLAPASTQKLFTAAAALELLGKDYRYKTEISYKAGLDNKPDYGYFLIHAGWDPTFGSSRYPYTKPGIILSRITSALKSNKVNTVQWEFKWEPKAGNSSNIPRGWIWEDIGNYYGAAPYLLNWRENQYDIILQSGKHIGDPVKVVEEKPYYFSLLSYTVNAKSAAKGSGDNAYVFNTPIGNRWIEGTIPVNEDSFAISASSDDPISFFQSQLADACREQGMKLDYTFDKDSLFTSTKRTIPLLTHYSPALDSIVYWFLRKSINLYGEALARTIAYEKAGPGKTEQGVEMIRDFWAQQGIDKSALHLMDGSGLSPQNRVTANAMVQVLQYAHTRPWYNAFYNALPEYNGMKMKSGSIGGARAFAGYHTAKDGAQYSFALIVNNYDGSAGEVVKKIYRLLDALK